MHSNVCNACKQGKQWCDCPRDLSFKELLVGGIAVASVFYGAAWLFMLIGAAMGPAP